MRAPRKYRTHITVTVGFIVIVVGALVGTSFSEVTTTAIPATTTTIQRDSTTTTSPSTTLPPVTTTTVNAEQEALEETLMVLSAPYQWGERSDLVRSLQTLLKIAVDGLYGPQTREAHLAAVTFFGLDTSIVPAVPVQTQTVYTKTCPQWEDLARSIGWAPEQINKLSYVIHRESTCRPESWNRNDPGTGSRGLTQINSFWCTPNKYNPTGWLQAQGILATCDDLFDPAVNLRAALAIWTRSGWRPWNV